MDRRHAINLANVPKWCNFYRRENTINNVEFLIEKSIVDIYVKAERGTPLEFTCAHPITRDNLIEVVRLLQLNENKKNRAFDILHSV